MLDEWRDCEQWHGNKSVILSRRKFKSLKSQSWHSQWVAKTSMVIPNCVIQEGKKKYLSVIVARFLDVMFTKCHGKETHHNTIIIFFIDCILYAVTNVCHLFFIELSEDGREVVLKSEHIGAALWNLLWPTLEIVLRRDTSALLYG